MKPGTKKILFGIWGVLAIVGLIGFFQRFIFGHQMANYGSYVPWGLWVAAYIFFVGLSAGAFLLSSLVYVFRVKVLEPIGRFSLVVAVITLLMALLSIWFDIGHMGRFWYVFIRPNFHSMMAWMIWLYTAYFVLLLWELKVAFGEPTTSNKKKLAILATIGVPLAIAFHGGVGALFAVVGARSYWHTGLFPILFLSGALTSGGALLLALVSFFWPSPGEAHRGLVKLLGRITLGLLLFDLVLEWAEISVPMWGGTAYHTEGTKLMLFGPFWWVFWILHLGLGSLLPIWILVRHPDNPRFLGIAGSLIAALFMTVRLNIVIPGLAVPILPGLENAIRNPRLNFSYVPSLHEWMVLAFVVALGIFLFAASRRWLPLFGNERRGTP